MDSINEIWMAVLNYMKPQVSETAYRMWLQDLILKNLDGKCAVVECNNQMKYNIVSEQYKEPLEAAFEEVIGFHVTVEITTRDNTPKEEVKPKDTHLLPTEQPGIFILLTPLLRAIPTNLLTVQPWRWQRIRAASAAKPTITRCLFTVPPDWVRPTCLTPFGTKFKTIFRKSVFFM